jgi:hypothetical protein
MSSQLSVSSLCKTIKALVAKGDQATKKAEEFYIAAGKHLAELKDRAPDQWESLAKEVMGIGRSRAYELMAIADGRKSLSDLREEKAESIRKTRALSPLRSGQIVWVHEETGEPCPDFAPPCNCGVPYVVEDGSGRRIVPRRSGEGES